MAMAGQRAMRPMGLLACGAAVGLLALSLASGRAAQGQTTRAEPARQAAPQHRVADAWVRLPAAPGRPGAGYFTLTPASADQLVAARSPRAERIEMHSMAMEGGTMRMRAEPGFDVVAGQALSFRPGGSHLMLFGLDPALRPGERVPVTLVFRSGAEIVVEAQTRAPGAR